MATMLYPRSLPTLHRSSRPVYADRSSCAIRYRNPRRRWFLDDGLDWNFCSSQDGASHGIPGGFGAGFVGSFFSAVIPPGVVGELCLRLNDLPDPNVDEGYLPVMISVDAPTPAARGSWGRIKSLYR